MEPEKSISETEFEKQLDSALESGELEEVDLLKIAVDYQENLITVFRDEEPSEFLLQFDGMRFEPDEDYEPEIDPEPERIEGSPSEPLSEPATLPGGEPEPSEEPEPPEA